VRKIPQSEKDRKVKEIQESFKLGGSGAPIPLKSVTKGIHDQPVCETTYGGLTDDIQIPEVWTDNLGHAETDDDLYLWAKDLHSATNPKPIKTNRTSKEIADGFLKKEAQKIKKEREKREARKYQGKTIHAKQLALKARRREFASQKARLILLMLENGQDYSCAECNTEDNLTVDHKLAVSRGGTDDLSNLQFLCQSCNSKKGTKLIKKPDKI